MMNAGSDFLIQPFRSHPFLSFLVVNYRSASFDASPGLTAEPTVPIFTCGRLQDVDPAQLDALSSLCHLSFALCPFLG
ncbi:MAG: hypothetical protein Q8O18_14350 [Deltaproteobacteria bacterium]|nr:hypothetical protein [Deltaproteobacteria bacterium]